MAITSSIVGSLVLLGAVGLMFAKRKRNNRASRGSARGASMREPLLLPGQQSPSSSRRSSPLRGVHGAGRVMGTAGARSAIMLAGQSSADVEAVLRALDGGGNRVSSTPPTLAGLLSDEELLLPGGDPLRRLRAGPRPPCASSIVVLAFDSTLLGMGNALLGPEGVLAPLHSALLGAGVLPERIAFVGTGEVCTSLLEADGLTPTEEFRQRLGAAQCTELERWSYLSAGRFFVFPWSLKQAERLKEWLVDCEPEHPAPLDSLPRPMHPQRLSGGVGGRGHHSGDLGSRTGGSGALARTSGPLSPAEGGAGAASEEESGSDEEWDTEWAFQRELDRREFEANENTKMCVAAARAPPGLSLLQPPARPPPVRPACFVHANDSLACSPPKPPRLLPGTPWLSLNATRARSTTRQTSAKFVATHARQRTRTLASACLVGSRCTFQRQCRPAAPGWRRVRARTLTSRSRGVRCGCASTMVSDGGA